MVRRAIPSTRGTTLYIGVDEAGYGPLLGPLCVAGSAFRVAEGLAKDGFQADLRVPLTGLVDKTPVGRRTRRAALPIPVDDSKRIKQRLGFDGLAQGVIALCQGLDKPPPRDLGDLLRRFSSRGRTELRGVPWYEDLRTAALPRRGALGRLRRRFSSAGVEPRDLLVRPVPARALNDAFTRTGNKAHVLGTVSMSLVVDILERHPGEDAIVVMDRQGGRRHYEDYLASHFPLSQISRLEGETGESRYLVSMPDRTLRFRFLTSGDRRCLAVAWASMAAKLTRELCMTCFNTWFRERDPGLRPTAGYVTDGRRFLVDAEGVIASEGLVAPLLVRER